MLSHIGATDIIQYLGNHQVCLFGSLPKSKGTFCDNNVCEMCVMLCLCVCVCMMLGNVLFQERQLLGV